MCFNVKVKNVAFDTSKIITNAWFSMKNYSFNNKQCIYDEAIEMTSPKCKFKHLMSILYKCI